MQSYISSETNTARVYIIDSTIFSDQRDRCAIHHSLQCLYTYIMLALRQGMIFHTNVRLWGSALYEGWVMPMFCVSFDVDLNKLLQKQASNHWFKTTWHSRDSTAMGTDCSGIVYCQRSTMSQRMHIPNGRNQLASAKPPRIALMGVELRVTVCR